MSQACKPLEKRGSRSIKNQCYQETVLIDFSVRHGVLNGVLYSYKVRSSVGTCMHASEDGLKLVICWQVIGFEAGNKNGGRWRKLLDRGRGCPIMKR